ncbi:GTP-binding protein EngB [hydrothermal vent metagenome]|uniref:GTP-binding protein EngB n=1 Tax=hydrothermal vent metagenome TaxID=652676 RepID=A0A3B1D2E2_9ZZZZ
MKVYSADFLTGAVSAKQYPKLSHPEFAFAGRSNVGKSSLLKSLLNRKKLVRTSSTPGKTQEINFFEINEKLIFTDLPGYGFAKVPKAVQRKWQNMIEQYVLKRETLTALIFIVDLRRDPTTLDMELKHWLDANGIRYILVGTKADKLSAGERSKQTKKIKQAFCREEDSEKLVVYSSKNNLGRKELWSQITKLANLQNAQTKEQENENP